MSKKALLFDWDSTIAMTGSVVLTVCKEAFKHVGIKDLSDREISTNINDLSWPKKICETEEKTKQFYKYVEGRIYDLLKEVKTYPGAKEALAQVAESYTLAVVSSSSRKSIDICLEANQLQGIFSTIVSEDDTESHKPDPEPVQLALARLRIKAEDCLFVGDSEKDTQASAHLSIPCIVFVPDIHKDIYDVEAVLAEPNAVASFKYWQELPSIVESML